MSEPRKVVLNVREKGQEAAKFGGYHFHVTVHFQHFDEDMLECVAKQLNDAVVYEGPHIKDEVIAALKEDLAAKQRELDQHRAQTELELSRLRSLESELESLANLPAFRR